MFVAQSLCWGVILELFKWNTAQQPPKKCSCIQPKLRAALHTTFCHNRWNEKPPLVHVKTNSPNKSKIER